MITGQTRRTDVLRSDGRRIEEYTHLKTLEITKRLDQHREQARSRALDWPRQPLKWLIVLFVAFLPALWFSLLATPRLRVDVGEWGDHSYLNGIHAIEQGANENYRWTTSQTQLVLPNLSNHDELLRWRGHGWRPDGSASPTVSLDVAGRAWGTFQVAPEMRVYQVLVPSSNNLNSVINLNSTVYREPSGRQLGVALDWIELATLGRATLPAPWQLMGQALLWGLVLAVIGMLGISQRWSIGAAAVLGGALLGANLRQPLWIGQALGAWLLLALAALLLCITLGPRVQRWLTPWMTQEHARIAWALLIGAFVLRVAGSVHPLFNSHDVDVHTGWLDKVTNGQIYLYSTPGEFRGKQTFNPPAGYVLMLPLRLLVDTRLSVQLGVALLDTLGCLVLLPIARELRVSGRAALLALALYVALPINTSMLWWGFATNAQAQTLALLLLWAMLRLLRAPSLTTSALFGVAASAALLTHVGALVLVAGLLGLMVLLSWRQLGPAAWKALFGTLLVVGFLAVTLYLSVAVAPLLGRGGSGLDLETAFNKAWNARALRAILIALGPIRGFLVPLLALFPLGLWLMWRDPHHHPQRGALIMAWLLVCGVFFAIDFGLGFLVRYVYFLTPLVCLASGVVLTRLVRHSVGRTMVVTLVLFVAWSGTALWVAGVLERVKPSALPLTH